MSDIPVIKPTEPVALSDGERTVAIEATKRLLVFLLDHGKAVSLIRYGVVIACGHEATVSDSTIGQTAALLVGAAMVAWSWWERHQQAHKAASAPLPTVQEIKQP